MSLHIYTHLHARAIPWPITEKLPFVDKRHRVQVQGVDVVASLSFELRIGCCHRWRELAGGVAL